MQAAVYYSNKDIRVEEVPKPDIGAKEILVKVIASGICGSDVMEWYRIKKAPRILGHEIAGEIVERGKDVQKFSVGDRVFVSHHVPCNECRYCNKGYHTVCDTLRSTNFDPGGFAQYIRVPEINIRFGTFLLPDEVSFDEGTFIEPLGCVIRGQRFANITKGNVVLIIGSGLSGLLHIQRAKTKGTEKVIATDINEYRLSAAEKFGADVAINAREDVPRIIKDNNQGRLADVVVVCTAANEAFKQAFASVDRAGTLLLFAPTAPDVQVPLPLFDLYFKGVKIIFSYAAVTQDITEAIESLRMKKINVAEMITHRFGLSDIQKGFDLVAKADKSIKVIIHPWGQA